MAFKSKSGGRRSSGDERIGQRKRVPKSKDESTQKSDFRSERGSGDEKKFFGKKPFGKPREFGDKSEGGFNRDEKRSYGKKPFGKPREFGDRSEGGFDRDEKKSFGKKPFGKPREFGDRSDGGFNRDEKKSFGKKPFGKPREFGDRSEGGFNRDEKRSFDKKPFGNPREFGDRSEGGFNRDERKSFDKKPFGKPREFGAGSEGGFNRDEKKSFGKKPFGKPRAFGERSEGGFDRDEKRSFGKKPFGKPRAFGDRSEGGFNRDEKRSFDKKPFGKPREFGDRSEGGFNRDEKKSFGKKPFSKSKSFDDKAETDPNRPAFKSYGKNPYKKSKEEKPESEFTRLNRLISNAGICSRREADEMIEAGLISVNGEIVTTLGTKVKRTDEVRYNGEPVRKEKLRYILLNKPKDYITTTDDPQQRHTVMELIDGACRERVYPVGRLDRNTTGLLLFTNDGELADKLMHPRCEVRKIYQVELDKNLKQDDLEKISKGIELEDGKVSVDEIAYGSTDDGKRVVGVTLHSGKNRIVRRIFEHLGYDVKKLDRVYYAGLTKKDLTRGRWRHLDEMELNMLKMIRKP